MRSGSSFLRFGGAVACALAFARPALAQQASAESHTVRKGDTLWDLAQRYLGDPFLWPEIYKLNTDVVEDPHWIYPGETLRLAGRPGVTSVPAEDTPAPTPAVAAAPGAPGAPAPVAPAPDRAVPAFPVAAAEPPMGEGEESLFPRADQRTRVIGDRLVVAMSRAYKPVSRSQFHSTPWLTEGRALAFGRIKGRVQPSEIYTSMVGTTSAQYDLLAVQPPAGGIYQAGDTITVVTNYTKLGGYGDVITPLGRAVVTVPTPNGLWTARVIELYGKIGPSDLLLPSERFADPGRVREQKVENGIEGRVIGWAATTEIMEPLQTIFLDKGRDAGVRLGDVFEVRRQPRATAEGGWFTDEVMAVVQVLHVGETTSSARIINILRPALEKGATVRQIRRLPG